MKRTRGFTLIELLVVIGIIGLLVSLLLPALAKASRNAKSTADSTQQREIHRTMLIWAQNNKDVLPTPGLINRRTDIYTNQDLPGTGPENKQKNITRHLYSSMIAQEYFNTDILIGPTEENPGIEQLLEYDYSTYAPTNDTYWYGDDSGNGVGEASEGLFAALDGSNECHTSFYHMALYGNRKKVKWRATSSDSDPVISTRGPQDGSLNGQGYERSYTLLLHGGAREWVGNIAYADNHVEVARSFYPDPVFYEPAEANSTRQKDNIFDDEFTDFEDVGIGGATYASGDAYQVMMSAVSINFPAGQETSATFYVEQLIP